ncbi:hypothetical protein [Nocardia seriolae]|uniref:Uncharacterized protein n=1 Tax=Nocardia seriolae TaxID=37332 RepID=A0A0B8NQ87_9NOCA|nr:hypothetical protein [Nocardia seriolae]APA97834.1 hypothetical protein NS506_03785 [Nocardia seriolae]MTJ64410.1 hypothetical protein [Nocardia seriolae]MTJ75397.1 hypothetical protein [Nocardia seriolae]MTJ87594.1 hypothetical protein [Nocardia seriolae]MTK31587.1 hypothetical protein [Nocardia seriolae]
MWFERPLTALVAAGFAVTLCTAGVAAADPYDPGTNAPDCPYPDVNNPACTNFPDDHNNEGDFDNHHDDTHHDGGDRR